MMRDKPPQRRFASGHRPRLMLGGLAAVGVTLSGCEPAEQQAAQFTSVAACTQAGFEASLCQSAQSAAEQEHQKSAPRFNSLASCEEEWGTSSCAPMTTPAIAGSSYNTGSVFVPMVAGFVLSQAMQRSFYQNGNIGYYGGGYGGGPVYRNRTGTPVTVGRSDGKMIKTPVNVNTASVSRRGFGGMGMSRGGSFGG
jgi:uncharacterized protein YgiB involved in biofilm formation